MAQVESVLDRRVRSLTLGLPLVVTLFAFDNLGVTTVMPRIARDLHGLGLYGWAFSAFTLASVVGLVNAGRQADLRGPAGPLAVGLALFVAGLAVTASAPDMPVVVVGRALQGLGSGAFATTMYVVIGRAYPAGLRPRMFAVLSSAWVLPSLIGPTLAGFVADTVGWRAVFVGLALLAPWPMTMTVPRLRELAGVGVAPGAGAAPAPIAAAVGVAAGAGAVVSGLAASSWVTFSVLVAGGVAVGLPSMNRILPRGTWRAGRGIPAVVGLRGLLNLAFFGTDAFIPLLLVRLHHLSATEAGIPLTAAGLSWTAASWAMGRVRARLGTTFCVVSGLALNIAGIGGVVAAIPARPALLVATCAWAVGGAGMGLAYNALSVSVVDLSPEGAEGETAAALQLTDALGVALGTGAGGGFVALAGRGALGLEPALLAQMALTAGVALASLGLGARVEPGPEPPEQPVPDGRTRAEHQ